MNEANLNLAAAQTYVECLGWPVFPCHSVRESGVCTCGKLACTDQGKHPRTEHGFKDATRDKGTIAGWWSEWPDANIGVPTGQASGFIAVDVDPRHGGPESLEDLEAEHGQLPHTVEQQTGGGGRHILFRYKEGICNKAGLRPGVDVRGEGGYIIVSPSLHPSGRSYEWELSSLPEEVDLADCPEWLLEILQPTNGQVKEPAPAVEGDILEGKRNATLISLAGSMRNRGQGEASIAAALLVENEQRCKPPLPEDEVRKIAASVARGFVARKA